MIISQVIHTKQHYSIPLCVCVSILKIINSRFPVSIRKTDADCLEFAKDGFGILLGICKRWISGQKHFAKGCPLKEKAAATRQLR